MKLTLRSTLVWLFLLLSFVSLSANENHRYYAWYSETQAEIMRDHHHALSIYLDTQDREVIVTEVTESPDKASGNFDDYVYLGEVSKWIRNVK